MKYKHSLYFEAYYYLNTYADCMEMSVVTGTYSKRVTSEIIVYSIYLCYLCTDSHSSLNSQYLSQQLRNHNVYQTVVNL